MSLAYFCCYSPEDLATINLVLATQVPWPTGLNVSFGEPAWRVDSDAATVDHYSAIVLLDDPSQAAMFGLVGEVEAAVRSAGVDVHVPRCAGLHGFFFFYSQRSVTALSERELFKYFEYKTGRLSCSSARSAGVARHMRDGGRGDVCTLSLPS